jgi:4-amino-4-deoxy-L-arabinose transferase-like glycosyltransferase
MGVLAMFLVADLTRLILGGRIASLIAALAWAGTFTVITEFRAATADPYLAFFTILAVWAWARASTRAARNRFALVLVFYASLGLGVMSKGPLVFLHVGLALAAYAWSVRRRPRAGATAHVVGLILLLAIAAPWPAYVLTHVENVTALWKMETTRGEGSHGIGFILSHLWELPARSFEIALPWIPFWIVGIAVTLKAKSRGRARIRDRRYAFPLIWYIATFAVFSFSPEKKSAYLLPVMPAQAMLVALGVLGARRMFKPALARGLIVAQAVIAAALAASAVIVIARLHDRPGAVAAAILTILSAAMLIAGIRRAMVWRANRWFPPFGAGIVLAGVAFGVLEMAARDNERSAKSFAGYAGQLLLPPANVLVPRLSAEASFYLPLGMRYDPAAPDALDVVEPPHGRTFDLSRYKPDLPHGKLLSAEIVPVPGEPPDPHWRLVRVYVGREEPITSPASRATPP